MILGDTDPLWDTFSGGEGHRDQPEWTAADGLVAGQFYAATPEGSARRLLDLLVDRPGQLLDADWLGQQIFGPAGSGSNRRNAVAASIRGMAAAQAESGRRYPFKWFEGRGGSPTRYIMKHYIAALFRQGRDDADGPGRGDDWNGAEVAATVDDYLAMLVAESAGRPYSKAEHRRALLPKLTPQRTSSAVEWKHRNISAAMVGLGLPYIRGYVPGDNRQAALSVEIQRRIDTEPALLTALTPAATGDREDLPALHRTEPPEHEAPSRGGRHVDYGALQEESSRVGRRGEELVVAYERDRLRREGRPDLADAVRWVADQDGDGLGYDVQSFDPSGTVRYIEVKTTAYGPDTPFYISAAELRFAQLHASQYALYRVSQVHDSAQFFILHGDISTAIETEPVTYRAWLRHTRQM